MRKFDLGFAGLPLDGEREEGLEASGVRDEEEGLVRTCSVDVILEGECEPEGFLGGESEGGRERLGRGEATGELSSASCEDTITIAKQPHSKPREEQGNMEIELEAKLTS